MRSWSTIRLVDFDGEGLGDLCSRTDTELSCTRSTGAAFEAPIVITPGGGWDDRSNYATLRTGDIDGDGAEDLCLRANAGVRCWAWDGSAFVSRTCRATSDMRRAQHEGQNP